jgi:hypothetical protein
MANEVDIGREKCLVRKVGRESKKVEDHCTRQPAADGSILFFILLSVDQ